MPYQDSEDTLMVQCPRCAGLGEIINPTTNQRSTCPLCHGNGMTTFARADRYNNAPAQANTNHHQNTPTTNNQDEPEERTVQCPRCRGQGSILLPSQNTPTRCPLCDGATVVGTSVASDWRASARTNQYEPKFTNPNT